MLRGGEDSGFSGRGARTVPQPRALPLWCQRGLPGELGVEEGPGAAGDVPPQQLQRTGRNVGGSTVTGRVREICSGPGAVAVFSPAVWPGKRGRLKLLWHRGA